MSTASPARRARCWPLVVGATGLALASALVSGGALQAAEEPVATPTVLVVDASASMARPLDGDRTRAEAVTASIGALTSAAPETTAVGVVTFGSNTDRRTLDASSCTDAEVATPPASLDDALTGARPMPADAIGDLPAIGRSPVAVGLQAARNALPPDGPGRIVLIADGPDDCVVATPVCERAAQLRTTSPALTIDVVTLGSPLEPTRREHACVAAAGGGSQTSVGSADQLAAALQALLAPESLGDGRGALTAAGINGVRLGMTLAEAATAAPDLVSGPVDADPVSARTPGAEIRFEQGRAVEIAPRDDLGTAEGLEVGARVGDAVALYGEGIGSGTGPGGAFELFRAAPNGEAAYRIHLASDLDTITRITLCACAEPDPAHEEGLDDAEALPDPPASTTVSGIDITPSIGGIGPIRVGMTEAELAANVPDLAVWTIEDPRNPSGWSSTPIDEWRADHATGDVCLIAGDLMAGGPHVAVIDGVVAAVTTKIIAPDRVTVDDSAVEVAAAYGPTTLESSGSIQQWIVDGNDGTTLQFLRASYGQTVAVGVYAADWTAYPTLDGEPCTLMQRR